MPFTPFHLGPGLLCGLLLLCYVDFPTFLIANVIVDVEPFLVLTLNLPYPLHGFFHSFIGGTLVALLLTAMMSKARETFSPLLSICKIEQTVSFNRILFASLSGIYLHIFLDSWMHRDIKPFYPLDLNPFLNVITPSETYRLCIWSFVVGAILYIVKFVVIWRKTSYNEK